MTSGTSGRLRPWLQRTDHPDLLTGTRRVGNRRAASRSAAECSVALASVHAEGAARGGGPGVRVRALGATRRAVPSSDATTCILDCATEASARAARIAGDSKDDVERASGADTRTAPRACPPRRERAPRPRAGWHPVALLATSRPRGPPLRRRCDTATHIRCGSCPRRRAEQVRHLAAPAASSTPTAAESSRRTPAIRSPGPDRLRHRTQPLPPTLIAIPPDARRDHAPGHSPPTTQTIAHPQSCRRPSENRHPPPNRLRGRDRPKADLLSVGGPDVPCEGGLDDSDHQPSRPTRSSIRACLDSARAGSQDLGASHAAA